jgi:hypothetical protein
VALATRDAWAGASARAALEAARRELSLSEAEFDAWAAACVV